MRTIDFIKEDLYLESKQGLLEKVTLLLQNRNIPPFKLLNAFLSATINGHLAVVERLLQDPRVDPSAGNNGAIQNASANGHLEVVERLLQDPRVDPNILHTCNINNLDVNQFSEKSLMILVNKLVFPATICKIRHWKPRIDEFCKELFGIANDLTVVLDETLDNNGLQRNIWETVYAYLEHKLPEL
jgi:hypothetical protein